MCGKLNVLVDSEIVIVIIVFKHYPSTYCLMQDSCSTFSNF